MGAGMLDQYLDGLLTEGDRAAFERGLSRDPALAGAIACQRRIDASLERLFVPADLDRVAAQLATAIVASPMPIAEPRRAVRPRTFAIAAGIALFVVVGVQVWTETGRRPIDPYAPQPWRSLSQVYEDTVDAGFRPQWVCKDDREFETTFRRRFGQSLAMLPPPPGIAWAGIDYCNSITPATTTVLAHVYGREVLLFVDRASGDKEASVAAGSGLNLFQKRLGGLVVYEYTPHDRAYMVDLLYVPGLAGP